MALLPEMKAHFVLDFKVVPMVMYREDLYATFEYDGVSISSRNLRRNDDDPSSFSLDAATTRLR